MYSVAVVAVVAVVLLFTKFKFHPLFALIGPYHYKDWDGSWIWDHSIYNVPITKQSLMCFDKIKVSPKGTIQTTFGPIVVTTFRKPIAENIYQTWVQHNVEQQKISKQRATWLLKNRGTAPIQTILDELCTHAQKAI